jgi:ectoine hydroxylase-related dioxygenase (phytanoyl-CoA dioxygenase family)
MAELTEQQIARFRAEGFLIVEDAVTAAELDGLRRQYAEWLAEASRRGESWGETADRKVRFDLDPVHTAEASAIWRINNPVEISDAYHAVMMGSRIPDMVVDLIGPNIKFHHSKTNTKPPHSDADVQFHQDFTGTPHSNSDIVTALLHLDSVSDENGCLRMVPGSHRGPIHRTWEGEVFTGMAASEIRAECERTAVSIEGPAGSVCLMHTRTLHGSRPNRSARPRGVFISVYTAADAVPLCESIVKSRLEGTMVRGRATRLARCEPCEVELPQIYGASSFRDIHERAIAAKI